VLWLRYRQRTSSTEFSSDFPVKLASFRMSSSSLSVLSSSSRESSLRIGRHVSKIASESILIFVARKRYGMKVGVWLGQVVDELVTKLMRGRACSLEQASAANECATVRQRSHEQTRYFQKW